MYKKQKQENVNVLEESDANFIRITNITNSNKKHNKSQLIVVYLLHIIKCNKVKCAIYKK